MSQGNQRKAQKSFDSSGGYEFCVHGTSFETCETQLVVQKDISADIESSTSQYFRQTLMFEFKIRFNMCDNVRENLQTRLRMGSSDTDTTTSCSSSTKTLEWIENKILQSDAHVTRSAFVTRVLVWTYIGENPENPSDFWIS